MNNVFLLALALLPVAGLAAWLLVDLVDASATLRSFEGFDGMHLEG